MKTFELWLDESGDFNNDAQKSVDGANPSLVGGLLIESGSFPEAYIRYVLPEDGTYHSVSESDQLDRFKKIEEKLYLNPNNKMVVFSNQECIMILDNNLTYLNIISEGILQLIRQLKSEYGTIHIKVIIANRVDTTTGLNYGQSIVPQMEYEKRLKEKLLITSLANAIDPSEWELQTASARRDKRLMLSDIICNTFFTKYRRKKFNAKERQYIENIYTDRKKTIVFTVFESVLEKQFKNYLMENKIGEAVATICLSTDEKMLIRSFELLKSNFMNRGIYDIRLQYKFISAYIEYYINVVRDFDSCIDYLKNLQKYYVSLLQNSNVNEAKDAAVRMELDIKFYLLTVYTHKGDIANSEKYEKECEELMSHIPASLDNISYKFRFELRKIVNLINRFDFWNAKKHCEHLVKQCEEVNELLSLIYVEEEARFDELGKALGNLVQINSFLLRKQPSLYQDAIRDSDRAIDIFYNVADKQRQYLYRVSLETEYGAFDCALIYLKKSLGCTEQDEVKTLWEKVSQNSIFALSAYVRLMAEGSIKNWNIASDMYEQFAKSGILMELEKNKKSFHPLQIIFWKTGTYCARNNMIQAAIKHYEKASEICFATDDLTMNIIGFAIEFECQSVMLQYGMKDARTNLKSIKKKIQKIKGQEEKEILENVFGKIETESLAPEYYWHLSRRVTY